MAALQPLTGARAIGSLTVRSTAGTPTLAKGSYCVPIVDGSIDYQRPFFVGADIALTTSGVTVPIASVNGGARHSALVPGTPMRWFPAEPSVEAASVVLVQPVGGVDGIVKSIVLYEQMAPEAARDLFAGGVGAYPAIVIAWENSRNYTTVGAGTTNRPDAWTIYVVVSRTDAYERRGADGLEILDTIEELLDGRGGVDGLRLSSPIAEVTGRGRRGISPQSFVYSLSLNTHRSVKRDDSISKGKAVPWTVTNIDATTGDLAGAPPADKTIVDDFKVDMTP